MVFRNAISLVLYKKWKRIGCAKIVLKVQEVDTFSKILSEFDKLNIKYESKKIKGEYAVAAIGPYYSEDIDVVTGVNGKFPLKLL